MKEEKRKRGKKVEKEEGREGGRNYVMIREEAEQNRWNGEHGVGESGCVLNL